MKGVFIGEFETRKWKIDEIISILKKYNFDTVYLEESVLPKSFYLRRAGFKCFAWVKFTSKSNEELCKLLGKYNGLIQGVCLDYVRCKDRVFPFGFLTLLPRLFRLKRLISTFKELTWTACLKCEDYTSFLFNELNRWFWGQPLIFMHKLFDKILLMSYHQEYAVGFSKCLWMVKECQRRFPNVVPIFQTYQDKPVVDYNRVWTEYRNYYKDKTYFRLGSCDLKSFE